MSKHKALELADSLDGHATKTWTREEAAAELRAQHALIVQMREELADLKSRMQPNVNGADETYFFIGLKQQISMSRMERLTAALAAADQYLNGEQA